MRFHCGRRAGDGLLTFFDDPLPGDEPDSKVVRLKLDFRIAFDELLSDWSGLDVGVGLGVSLASGYPTM